MEILVRVEPGEDLRHSTTTYTAYSEINSVFVVDGLLLYTRTEPAASGIHDQTVYLIDREQKSGQPAGLVLIGETGAATRYSLQP